MTEPDDTIRDVAAINKAADAEAAERRALLAHGGKLVPATEIRVGDLISLGHRDGEGTIVWAEVVSVDVKPIQVWMYVQLPPPYIGGGQFRPRRDDELVVRR